MIASLLKAMSRGKVERAEEDWPREYAVDSGASAPEGDAAERHELEVCQRILLCTAQHSVLDPLPC